MLTIIDIRKKINVALNVVKKLPVDLKGNNSAINIYKNGLKIEFWIKKDLKVIKIQKETISKSPITPKSVNISK